MHRDWRHSCSEEWLRARRPYLTASDIKRLLPNYRKIKEGKLRPEEALQFVSVYGGKRETNLDEMSFGAMARGHYMEPFAVEEFNETRHQGFYHWDDKIIVDNETMLGFSPDALNLPPLPGTRMVAEGLSIRHRDGVSAGPTRILEIKSYEGPTHFQRKMIVANGEPLDERWQIACAMAVCKSLCMASVMFYAPQCRDMFFVDYDRFDLESEIQVCLEISEMYRTASNAADATSGAFTRYSEDDIYNRYLLDEMSGK